MSLPKCTKCGSNKWSGIPDSLAYFCEGCGEVIVGSGNGPYERGASLQEWAKDVYDAQQSKKSNKEE